MAYTDIIVGMSGTGVSRAGFGFPVKAAIDDLDSRVSAVEGQIFATQSVSFTSQTSVSVAVSFGVTFQAPPQVFTEIISGAGVTSRWGSRAISITTTGFTLFLFTMDAASSAATWSGVPVNWRAFPVS